MVKTRQHLVPNNIAFVAPGTNQCKYIAVHETANASRGADANAHARLQAGGSDRASWGWQVDDKEAVQSYLDTTRTWHAGDSSYALDAISVEICVNADGDYDKALQNAAELVAMLRKEHGIPANRVISHNWITGKACPAIMLADGRWSEFLAATDPAGAKKIKPAGPASSAPRPSTGGDTAGWPEHDLPRTDKHTTASHNAWVALMTAIDWTDEDLGKNLQSWLNSLTDPRTGRGYYDLSVYNHDGIMGPVGVKGLQRKLYDTEALGKKHLYYGVADGHRGPLTVRAEIDYLNWQRRFLI